MLNDSSCAPAHNTPLPLERSPPASFKRLLGSMLGRRRELIAVELGQPHCQPVVVYAFHVVARSFRSTLQHSDHRPQIADPGLAADALSAVDLTSGMAKTHDLDLIEFFEDACAVFGHVRAA